MNSNSPTFSEKLRWSLPWMMRYPLWRAGEMLRRFTDGTSSHHLIFIVANHFEPGWHESGVNLDWPVQMQRVSSWCAKARAIGSVRDADGTPFRHTYFYPGEQYYAPIIDRLAELQSEGLGEVEIHLHHGVDIPDTACNLRRSLEIFRDLLAGRHKCLSVLPGSDLPMYAFVHGNFALANSAGGRYCGVDSEMQILADTGCYADLSLPSIPHQSQVPRINAIYECGHPLEEAVPHRSGPGLRKGRTPRLPVILTGPLALDWRRRKKGIPVPRIDDGAIAGNYRLSLERLNRWRGARITVEGRPDWVFIKLYCHGFFPSDEETTIGEPMRRFLEESIEYGSRSGQFKVHFASAREAFNMIMAAVDGRSGEPGLYRDYALQQIMRSGREPVAEDGVAAIESAAAHTA